jgi:hypothetical protein
MVRENSESQHDVDAGINKRNAWRCDGRGHITIMSVHVHRRLVTRVVMIASGDIWRPPMPES